MPSASSGSSTPSSWLSRRPPDGLATDPESVARPRLASSAVGREMGWRSGLPGFDIRHGEQARRVEIATSRRGADYPDPAEMTSRHTCDAAVDARLAGLDESLRELRERIAALRNSVVGLDRGPPPATPYPSPHPAAEQPVRTPARQPVPAPPVAPSGEGDELVSRLRGLLDELKGVTEQHREPPAAPAPESPPPSPPPSSPPPAADVAVVDAGPFADLIALRSFEEALMSLPGVQDLRVRRFSHRRAEIQLRLSGPISAERALMRLGYEVGVQQEAGGVIRVDLPSRREPGS